LQAAPRTEAAIVAALTGRHPKDDVRRTVMRLAVLGQLAMQGGRGALAVGVAGQQPAQFYQTIEGGGGQGGQGRGSVGGGGGTGG
jgi:hypothetical protein